MATHRERDTQNDIPPHSRLFVIAGKDIKEEEYRECFSKYGEVEDIWIVKDRRTNEAKGITYIKFSLASEAALAVEEMNGHTIGDHPKPVKVIIASNRKDGNVRDPREEEKQVRLFVVCPKKCTEADLREEFKQFGDIEFIQIVKDKGTGENKGFGYVKFHRAYHAALALENCNASFRPKFAEPKIRKEDRDRLDRDDYDSNRSYDRYDRFDRFDRESRSSSNYGSKRLYPDTPMFENFSFPDERISGNQFGLGSPMALSQQMAMQQAPAAGAIGGMGPAEMLQTYPSSNCHRLHITAPIGMTQAYLSRLFNLIPGLEYCDLNEQTGVAYARYQTTQCAAYAHDKLDGFEYPIGSRLIVRYADSQPPADLTASALKGSSPMPGGSGGFMNQRAGLDGGNMSNRGCERVRYCNLLLPLPQEILPSQTPAKVRLFVVCQPVSIPEKILLDVFCRFGGLIDVFMLSGRNYGYAKYADTACAQKAIETLHGQTVAGSRLKVLEADPPKSEREGGRRDDRNRDDVHMVEESPNKKQRI